MDDKVVLKKKKVIIILFYLSFISFDVISLITGLLLTVFRKEWNYIINPVYSFFVDLYLVFIGIIAIFAITMLIIFYTSKKKFSLQDLLVSLVTSTTSIDFIGENFFSNLEKSNLGKYCPQSLLINIFVVLSFLKLH